MSPFGLKSLLEFDAMKIKLIFSPVISGGQQRLTLFGSNSSSSGTSIEKFSEYPSRYYEHSHLNEGAREMVRDKELDALEFIVVADFVTIEGTSETWYYISFRTLVVRAQKVNK